MTYDNQKAIRRALRLARGGYAGGGAGMGGVATQGGPDGAAGAPAKGFTPSGGDAQGPQVMGSPDAAGAPPKGFTPGGGEGGPPPYMQSQGFGPGVNNYQPAPQPAPLPTGPSADFYQNLLSGMQFAQPTYRAYRPGDFAPQQLRQTYTFNPATDPSRIVNAELARLKAEKEAGQNQTQAPAASDYNYIDYGGGGDSGAGEGGPGGNANGGRIVNRRPFALGGQPTADDYESQYVSYGALPVNFDGGNFGAPDPGAPTGAPGTGNIGQDAVSFAEATGPAMAGAAVGAALGGVPGAVAGMVGATMAQGLAEATGLSAPATSPPGGLASVAGNIAQTQMGMTPTSNPAEAVAAAVTGPQSPADQEDADQGAAAAAAAAAAQAAAEADNTNSMSEASTADAAGPGDDSGGPGGDGDFARGGVVGYADGGMPPRDLDADPAVQQALDLTRNSNVSPVEAARSVAIGENYGGQDAPAYSQARPEAGGLPIGRGVSGSEGIIPSSHQAPLEGLPTRIKVPHTGEVITAGPNHTVRAVAEQYMRDAGLPYNPPTKYAKVDAARAKRIADEYERMADDPTHPLVRAAYDAMIKETMAQYQAAKAAGFKAEFWDPEKERDPYEASPRLAIEDVNKNHHMYVFPTYFGYGSKEVPADAAQKNPLLADSGERWNGYPVTVNDIFRAVHDYFGHAKEGVGFRHDGEENAWRSHASMYSPLARLAMTSETRGQNSWLNFGPHGEKNRNARTEDTVFADQKIGVMAPWTTHEGAEDFLRPEDREAMEKVYKQYKKARGGSIGYADGGMPDDDPTVQQALDITRQAQPSAPDLARQIQPQAQLQPTNPFSVVDQYRGTGLSFPEKDNAARLALKAKRENLLAQGKAAGNPANSRMVIRAPKAPDGEKQLPDFIVGQLNHQDWIDRHESILSPSEIHQASQWYKRVKGTFDTFYPNDPELSKTMMRAWLVAQQNVSPAGAMNNVLMQREQMLRGDPEETWQAGGMPMPTQAARSVLRQQPIEMGVGQKIADFVDSAEGKPVRSWMGNHPDGGAPFVVDVHTARDTGMVDEELLNHLRRLGYDQDDLSNVKIDLKGSPTEAAYENRAQWGRGLTKYLNSIKWQGKSNWTPEEIQAVGWMGMTKLTRNAEEDSESGLNRNLRRLSFETAPGEGSPWEKKYGQAFAALSPEQQRDLTHKMNEEALNHVAKLSGIDVRHLVHGTGAWEKYQSPASVGQALMTQKGGDIAANALGYLLNQTEVWHHRAKPLGGTKNPAGFAVDFIQKNGHDLADPAYLQDFWQKISDADPHDIIKGYQPIKLPTGEVGIRAIITKGGEKTKGLIENLIGQDGPIRKIIEDSPHDLEVMGHEAEVTRAVNDWKENPNGEAYMERLVKLLGSNPRAKLAAIRSQLEEKLESHLNEISGGKNQQVRKSSGKQKAQLEKAGGGLISKNPELLDRALRLTASNRPMVALADLFQRQLRGRPPS